MARHLAESGDAYKASSESSAELQHVGYGLREKMAYHPSGVGRGMPDLMSKDPDLTLTGSYK